ncbi:MAG: hypothetical protein LH469_04365, partial [Frankiaceae bacterium]|nr:hypothetical protein [Frankiaceae bacterium]
LRRRPAAAPPGAAVRAGAAAGRAAGLGGVAGDLLELVVAGLLGGAAWAGSAVLLARPDAAALARQLRS